MADNDSVIQQQVERIQELEHKLRFVRRQLEQFTGPQMGAIGAEKWAIFRHYQEEYAKKNPTAQNINGMPDGCTYDG